MRMFVYLSHSIFSSLISSSISTLNYGPLYVPYILLNLKEIIELNNPHLQIYLCTNHV